MASLVGTLRKLNISKGKATLTNVDLAAALKVSWQGLLSTLLVIGVSTAVMFSLKLEVYNVNMVYMLATLAVTVWFGLAAGVLTAILAFFCFDYFFIPPIFTFIINALQGWIAIFLFLGTALLANQVAGRARLNSQKAQARTQEVTALYELATTVITRIDRTDMLQAVLQHVVTALDIDSCTLFLAAEPDAQGHELSLEKALFAQKPAEESEMADASSNNEQPVDNQRVSFQTVQHPNLGLALAAFGRNQPAFFSLEYYDDFATATLLIASSPPNISHFIPLSESASKGKSQVAYLPLASGSHRLGVLVLLKRNQATFEVEERRLYEIFASHVALAVEHARLVEETAQVAALRDTDRLKSALLASVSHELRTPLTSVKTAVGNLLAKDIEWTVEERNEFLTIIDQETDRQTRLVSNLLDLSRMEAGVLKPDFGWYYLPEIIEEVIERLKSSPVTSTHLITSRFVPEIPLARMDYLQIDQVLTNLIENAAKYSEPGKPIQVQVEIVIASEILHQPISKVSGSELAIGQPQSGQTILVVKIIDEGVGIPSGQLEYIFDKFYRVQSEQNDLVARVPGSGIGLTIAKGIVEAHGGEIWAQNRLYGGSIFTFTLPVTSHGT